MSPLRLPQSVRDGVASTRVRAIALPSTGLELVDRALARLVDVIRPLLAHPRADQVTLHDVAFTGSTPVQLSHRLNRAYRGWSVVRVRGASATFVETSQTPAALDLLQLTLTSSATCIADVEVW